MPPDQTELLLRQAAARLRDEGDQIAEAVAGSVFASLATSWGREVGGEPTRLPAGPGGRSSSTPSRTDRQDRHRRELESLRDRKERDSLDTEQLRRIAELTELLDGEDAARPWWQAAADAGDDLAADVLQELYGD